ncbi:MAG: NlpC/P60 family protein [Ancrocorticia sp.]
MFHSTHQRSLRAVAGFAAMALPLGLSLPAVASETAGAAPASVETSSTTSKAHKFLLSNQWKGAVNVEFTWGDAGYEVLVGDWDGDGKDTIALRKGNQFAFSNKNPASGTPAFTFTLGKASDTVLVGDWDGNGQDSIALRRGNTFYIKNHLSGDGFASVFSYGKASDEIFVGDWDGNGTDTLAVRRGNQIHVSNTNGRTDKVVAFGRAGDKLYVGSFDRSRPGRDSFAVRRGNTYFINKAMTSGAADFQLTYGRANDVALVGDWNGDGEDTLGLVRTHTTAAATQPKAPVVKKATGAQVLALAKKYPQTPYVKGGVTPKGWDCIGIVRYVYKQYGVEIGGRPASVLDAGKRIPFSEAKPGDILYWPKDRTKKGTYEHVALYVDAKENFGAWNSKYGTRQGPNSWIGQTPIVVRVFD